LHARMILRQLELLAEEMLEDRVAAFLQESGYVMDADLVSLRDLNARAAVYESVGESEDDLGISLVALSEAIVARRHGVQEPHLEIERIELLAREGLEPFGRVSERLGHATRRRSTTLRCTTVWRNVRNRPRAGSWRAMSVLFISRRISWTKSSRSASARRG